MLSKMKFLNTCTWNQLLRKRIMQWSLFSYRFAQYNGAKKILNTLKLFRETYFIAHIFHQGLCYFMYFRGEKFFQEVQPATENTYCDKEYNSHVPRVSLF